MKKRLLQYKLRLSAATQQDLAMWVSFLHQYNGITMFGHRKALTAHQLGIQEGWQVEKGGHFLNRRWPKYLQAEWQLQGHLCSHGWWWQKSGGKHSKTIDW